MRLLFAKQREEIRIVRKSVTLVQMETGGPVFRANGSAVIDLLHETPSSDRVLLTRPSQTLSRQESKNTPDLNARAEQMTDFVGLHGRSSDDGPCSITYSLPMTCRGSLRIDRFVDKGVAKQPGGFVPCHGRAGVGESDASCSRRFDHGKPLTSDLRVCKFAAIQKMTERRSCPTAGTSTIVIEV